MLVDAPLWVKRMSKGKRHAATHKACTFPTEEGTLLACNIFRGCSITLLHAKGSAKNSPSSLPGYVFKEIVCTFPQNITLPRQNSMP